MNVCGLMNQIKAKSETSLSIRHVTVSALLLCEVFKSLPQCHEY